MRDNSLLVLSPFYSKLHNYRIDVVQIARLHKLLARILHIKTYQYLGLRHAQEAIIVAGDAIRSEIARLGFMHCTR